MMTIIILISKKEKNMKWSYTIFLFFFRITAHAQLASALTAATDKLIFHPNHDKVTEELKRHKKDELVKDAILIEMKKKDIALNDIILAKNKEIDNLTTKISGLSYELRAAERNGEASKVRTYVRVRLWIIGRARVLAWICVRVFVVHVSVYLFRYCLHVYVCVCVYDDYDEYFVNFLTVL